MAKTVNNVKINTTFTTATAREQLTSGENLCTSLGKINKYLVDLDAGAFSFPANGGNADTVDDKHAADIMNMEFSFINRASITEGDLNNYTTAGAYVVLQSIAEDTLANQPFYNSGYYLNVYRRNATLITQIAMTWDGLIKIRFCAAEKWYDWKNIADGGNADTVDNKHASEFMQFLGDFRSGSILETVLTLNGSGYVYFGSANCTDMPVDGQYYFAEVRKLSTNYEIVATQFGSGTVFTNRYNGASKVWYGWKNVADGGNAASVGAYTEAKLAALEARVAALEGK